MPGLFGCSLARAGAQSAACSAVRARTVDELDVRHRRAVADAEAALQDARVAALALAVTRAELDEELADRDLVAKTRKSEAAIGDAVGLGERDQRLGDATQFLRLRQRGADQFVLEQRGRHVLEHRFAMAARAVEFAARFHVTHDEFLDFDCYEKSGEGRVPAVSRL